VTVTLPLVFVLGVIAWLAIRFLGIRPWAVVVIALFGFYLAHSFLAPAIDATTRSGVTAVTHH
jgi:F0F1-type ATP synthase assembly protein I